MTIISIVLLALITLAAIITVLLVRDLRMCLKTRNVQSPLFFSLPPEQLCAYIANSHYRWRKELENGHAVYVGELHRGFGRWYGITWKPGSATLAVENHGWAQLWIFRWGRGASVETSEISEEVGRKLTQAIDLQLRGQR